ncbi:hypothetical protein PILCRDRAFT_4785 [Piloderma croceum F 1598]|uniref:Uncharacterized protein n=1 Tax=Piloderma croceum (strain F 1598) TaxID=765440 RepID=A0A0C3G345_PILCF|nr:hypothetical protein PILCRDRAFT_4785 [Piloderma croceum F 1598]
MNHPFEILLRSAKTAGFVEGLQKGHCDAEKELAGLQDDEGVAMRDGGTCGSGLWSVWDPGAVSGVLACHPARQSFQTESGTPPSYCAILTYLGKLTISLGLSPLYTIYLY